MIAVVDYGIGNLRSAEKALQHLGADARAHGRRRRDRAAPTRSCCPGVGHFGACMRALRDSGLEAVDEGSGHRRPAVPRRLRRHADAVRRQRRVARRRRASASSPGRVTRLPDTVRLPQIGWNTLEVAAGQPARAPGSTPTVAATSCTRSRPSPTTTRSSPRGASTAAGSRPRSSAGPCGRRSSTPRRAATVGLRAAGELRRRGRGVTLMDLYPAIDLRGGRVVRLQQGDYDARDASTATIRSRSRARFEAAGARWIHVVDLDAARDGGDREPAASIEAICANVSRARCRRGGGVRSVEDAASAARSRRRARRRSAAPRSSTPSSSTSSPTRIPGRVAVGLDARGRDVAIHGWTDDDRRSTSSTSRGGSTGPGVGALVVTEIGARRHARRARPRTARGRARRRRSVPVIASGGVGDARRPARSSPRSRSTGRRLAGAIVGRAIYEGRFTVEEGIAACSPSA